MNYHKLLFLAAVGLTSCHSHYQLTGVERTRIVIDQRFDRQPDAAAAAFLAPYRHKVDSLMGPIVGEVAHDMAAARPESDLSNLLADIMVWAAKDYGETVDMGLYNMGGIRAALTRGPVTIGDVLNVAPFDNKICFITLKGDVLTQLFEQIARRGGEGVSHGVSLVITPTGELVSARLNGEPIDPAREYRLATIDYLLGGNDNMPALREHTNANAPSEESNNSRFIIMNYFREQTAQGKAVSAQTEGRIVIENN